MHKGSSAEVYEKQDYVKNVVQGKGFIHWQAIEKESQEEIDFRNRIEKIKDKLLSSKEKILHPILLGSENIETAKKNMINSKLGNTFFIHHKEIADFIISQPDHYIDKMIPRLTPLYQYGFTCPNCVGRLSQEGMGADIAIWNYLRPDEIICNYCDHKYPSNIYREQAKLVLPRKEQSFLFYRNRNEVLSGDYTGRYAYHWAGRPTHVSFSGLIRYKKVEFMISALKSCAIAYLIENKVDYAKAVEKILGRLALCYPDWIYHDYFNTFADCDPIYAAWNDKNLKLTWKKALTTETFINDKVDQASMSVDYYGAGKYRPSTDWIQTLATICFAYDCIVPARDVNGNKVLADDARSLIERNLILEWILSAEPYVKNGHENKNIGNKMARIYNAYASVSVTLGIASYADIALGGYEAIRDHNFFFDGFSQESPAYNDLFVRNLIAIPEISKLLSPYRKNCCKFNLFENDKKLTLIFKAIADQLNPAGYYYPLSDTSVAQTPDRRIIETGFKRMPKLFNNKVRFINDGQMISSYGFFKLDLKETEQKLTSKQQDVFFPGWMTAFLKHATDGTDSVAILSFNPPGTHRHRDNLSLYYSDRGQTILGDLGYVLDMPINKWIRHSFSHNLVIVDNLKQSSNRIPSIRFMASSPKISVIEAESKSYPICKDYRRLIALLKGPLNQTILVDIFRVKGGGVHDYRIFSELASSDAEDGDLVFHGIKDQPLRKISAEAVRCCRDEIFGLENYFVNNKPPGAWQAEWRQIDRSYRLWMVTPLSKIIVSTGPGQERQHQIGRRVRYLQAIREGENLKSSFVAIHEPSGVNDKNPVLDVLPFDLPKHCGDDAIALKIQTIWGLYYLFSEFAKEFEIEGIKFEGTFGIFCRSFEREDWIFALGAKTLQRSKFGIRGKANYWIGSTYGNDNYSMQTDVKRPDNWTKTPADCVQYVTVSQIVHSDNYRYKLPLIKTAYPLAKTTESTIAVRRFPLQNVKSFILPALDYLPGN
jgi:hypothetical protein